MQGENFTEGVKRVLIDKNHKPQWSHSDPLTIPEAVVQEHFGKQ
jgi:Enoyl-CoA hydratase/isomerase